MSSFTPRVFSGMQPTGNLHLGNYLGAMLNWIKLQETHESIYCVVDMHAITLWQEPKELHKSILEVTAAYLACGLDPSQSAAGRTDRWRPGPGRANHGWTATDWDAAREEVVKYDPPSRKWRNWQTHQLEGLALARA